MNAAMREGSVKVVYNSAAVVRNSSVEVKLVVLTEGWPAVLVVVVLGACFVVLGFAFVIEDVDDVVIVVGCRVEVPPVACCKSLPCSLMRAGPIFDSFCRS